ncbi:hypothetical protein [Pontibacter chitinilyticus]|uniref:hypothetical protein n=1 Tax=Pontibacter chitinilyticus TaxID=2674989 RepID=UPI00321AD73C
MSEIHTFLKEVASCDQLVYTRVNEECFYCRFYASGCYRDRVFVTDSALLEALSRLREDELIEAREVARLALCCQV